MNKHYKKKVVHCKLVLLSEVSKYDVVSSKSHEKMAEKLGLKMWAIENNKKIQQQVIQNEDKS